MLQGQPEARAQDIFDMSSGAMRLVAWSCTKGSFEWHYNLHELCYFLSGEVFISERGGPERRIEAGDTVFFPAGTVHVWRVTQDVRKLAVTHLPIPRMAGTALRVWNRISRTVRHQLKRMAVTA